MPVALSALLRGGLAVVVVVLGAALVWIVSLWWGGGVGGSPNLWWWLSAILAFGTGTGALVLLYGPQPSKPATVLMVLGSLAMGVVYLAGATTVHDITMSKVGVDAQAIVDRVWTTKLRGQTNYHCTLRRTDGTPLPRELASDCEDFEIGDTLPVVLDPHERFAPHLGRKSDLATTGGIVVVVGAAALIVLIVIAIGSPPKRSRRWKTSPLMS